MGQERGWNLFSSAWEEAGRGEEFQLCLCGLMVDSHAEPEQNHHCGSIGVFWDVCATFTSCFLASLGVGDEDELTDVSTCLFPGCCATERKEVLSADLMRSCWSSGRNISPSHHEQAVSLLMMAFLSLLIIQPLQQNLCFSGGSWSRWCTFTLDSPEFQMWEADRTSIP